MKIYFYWIAGAAIVLSLLTACGKAESDAKPGMVEDAHPHDHDHGHGPHDASDHHH